MKREEGMGILKDRDTHFMTGLFGERRRGIKRATERGGGNGWLNK